MLIFNYSGLKALNERANFHYKKSSVVMAVILLICGICCFIYPLIAGLYLSYLTGVMLLMSGFYTLYSLLVFRHQSWKSKCGDLLFAVIWLLLGYGFITNPLIAMESLSAVFCIMFIIGGLFRLVYGFRMVNHAGWGWNISIGLFDLLIAGLWMGLDPERSYLFTTAFIGLEMIFSAWSLLSVHKGKKYPQWKEISAKK